MIDISELDEGALEDILSEPTDATKELIAGLKGDIVVLGAGGKMGPTLAMMLKKASSGKNIYAVSRFSLRSPKDSDKAVRTKIERAGIKTIQLDLLDESLYSQLPDVENVFYLVGMKFGSTGNQPFCGFRDIYRN
jgi:nucleoside-diphosphate-sugar epimerase